MFLKSLTLKGFKSFAETTTLEFEPGVTVVVGPNGSGKSNIVDAVAWVLGAQGPRTVRSGKMEDVIFAGTAKRPALGRAEVSLTIDNSAGLLPIDFSEVTITRTLFRTGESEYAINRVPCRLLDIQELLSDTGVGRQQHVIVSQGNLDAILSSRPEERRDAIEEAAGILKYRRRKEKAERRLESTESSLVRLQDLFREVRRQLRPLEKQAEAARRHGDLVAELAAVRRYLLGRDLAGVEARLTAAVRDRAELGRSEEEIRQALSRLDAEIVVVEAQVAETLPRGPDVDLAEAVSRAESLRARARGLVAVLGERKRSIERSLAATVDQDVISSLEADAALLTDRLAATDDEARRLLPQADDLTAAEEGLAADAEAFEADWSGDGPRLVDPAAEVRGELGALRSALERSAGEARRLDTAIASLGQRAGRMAGEADRLRTVATESTGSAPQLSAADESARADELVSEAALEAAGEERRQAEADHHRWEAREEALAQALDQARARAGAERLADVRGVVGTLLELVEIDDGFETAFEAAAGEALAAVVMDGAESARAGLAELHRLQSPGAVLALPAGPGHTGSACGAAEVPAGRPVRRTVRAWLPNVTALLDRLLASAVVVDGSWAQALDLSIEHPELVVVTRAGDRFVDGLWHTGAGGAGATGAAREEARRQADAAADRATRAEVAFRDARRRAEEARARRGAASRELETNTARGRSATDGLAPDRGGSGRRGSGAGHGPDPTSGARAALVEGPGPHRRARDDAPRPGAGRRGPGRAGGGRTGGPFAPGRARRGGGRHAAGPRGPGRRARGAQDPDRPAPPGGRGAAAAQRRGARRSGRTPDPPDPAGSRHRRAGPDGWRPGGCHRRHGRPPPGGPPARRSRRSGSGPAGSTSSAGSAGRRSAS